MYTTVYVLHVAAAIAMLIYLSLPFLIRRAASLPQHAQAGAARRISRLNRTAQLLLVIGFLSGGYMIGKVFAAYSVLWTILAVVLVLAIGAFSGIMGKSLRRWASQQGTEADRSKLKRFSTLAAVCYVLIMLMMLYPNILM